MGVTNTANDSEVWTDGLMLHTHRRIPSTQNPGDTSQHVGLVLKRNNQAERTEIRKVGLGLGKRLWN